MAKRGRPPKSDNSNIHKVIYYQPKPELALKALQNVKKDRLLAGYKKLFFLAHDKEANQRDMVEINRVMKELGF